MVRFVKKSGSSTDEAIIVLYAKNSPEGIAAEYFYLESLFGKADQDWKLLKQACCGKGDKHFDEMCLIFPDGTTKTIFFDITAFYYS